MSEERSFPRLVNRVSELERQLTESVTFTEHPGGLHRWRAHWRGHHAFGLTKLDALLRLARYVDQLEQAEGRAVL